ncbi:MAG: GntR family transcriptional regulator [Conexibacteraceae bacterium]|nr:GntR family transcriptional regulator [Conexibacteraceae bacterium]
MTPNGTSTTPETAAAAAEHPAATEPKYYTVKRHLLEFIGSLDPGSAVPTERELATELQTSRTTVRQALGELVVEGRLVRRQGSGTYVAEPKITWPLYLASFTEQVEASGFKPSAQVLATQRIPANAELARQLGLRPRASVYKIERVRFADAAPIAVETSWLPAERFPGLTRHIRQRGSLHAILADTYGTTLRTGDEWIETAPATPREAGPLQVDVGTPMLIVGRQNFDSDNTPVELGRTWFRSDRVTLVTHLATQR